MSETVKKALEQYTTTGTCSTRITFEIQDGRVTFCKFHGGCAGNTQAVARLVTGREVGEVVRLLKGVQCRNGTSCPDQLAQALEAHAAKGPPSGQ
jgi:uncharacterized protein (TIGR03905 family)